MAQTIPLEGLKILAATDLSTAADEAIRQAHQWAAAWNGELLVCHVVEGPPRSNVLFPQQNEGDALAALAWEQRVAGKVSERVMAVTGRGAEDFRVLIDSGSPETNIVSDAEENAAGLIVIGARGETPIERLLLGSVAERVIRYAHCSVLVARPHAETGEVLASTDLSDPSLPAVIAAAVEATRRGATLTVVYGVEPWPGASAPTETGLPSEGGPSGVLLPDRVREAAERKLREILTKAQVNAETLITAGDPAASILGAAAARKAELVVIGTRGRTGIARLALGSVAERVVQAADCSVMVVRLGAPNPS
jgi:nucleotide-binding universal stress UspA family protein